MSGITVQKGRYVLQKTLRVQEWLPGITETIWYARDRAQGDTPLTLHEIALAQDVSPHLRVIPVRAEQTFRMLKHPGIPPLREVFTERDRDFFVFEPVHGFSLLTLMRSAGGRLAEQDMVECCLQLTEVLALLAHQSLPMAHGNIRPEQIIKKRAGSSYVLTQFSVALAGGIAQFAINPGSLRLSPYAAPEVAEGKVTLYADLYALLASIFHMITGKVPGQSDNEVFASLSPALQTLLDRGLSTSSLQRYRQPAELARDLLAARATYPHQAVKASPTSGELKEQGVASSSLTGTTSGPFTTLSFVPLDLSGVNVKPESPVAASLAIEASQMQAPLEEGPDLRNAILWFVGMIFCLLLFLLRRGFM